MIPWKDVLCLEQAEEDGALQARVASSTYTRLPVRSGQQVLGYVHQLDVLQAGREVPVLEHLQSLFFVDPQLSVDRALAQLRVTGRRLAVVGCAEAPLGLVTLKDLLEEISGELGGW
jgi:CBS domain containing-hemolysin-like protein